MVPGHFSNELKPKSGDAATEYVRKAQENTARARATGFKRSRTITVSPRLRHQLELRFRSSQAIAATSDANFGIKGALAIIFSSAAFLFDVPGSNSPRMVQERQIGGTSAHFPKFVLHLRTHLSRTSESYGH